MPTTLTEASNLRQFLRAARRQITGTLREQYSDQLRQRVLQNPNVITAKRLGCFLSLPEEIDTRPLIAAAQAAGKQIFLPVIIAPDVPLKFAHFTNESHCQLSLFKTQEPIYENVNDLLDVGELDCVLTPLVGFDLLGNRLGMGGGFYDRSFASCQASTSPKRIGLAYEIQKVMQLYSKPWDVPLNGVITEITDYVF